MRVVVEINTLTHKITTMENMENKQTAVEWLGLYIKGITNLNCDEVIHQALAMEKEQIIYSYKHGQNNGFMYSDGNGLKIEAEQYYNETYKGGDK
jgi:hypothetical protein